MSNLIWVCTVCIQYPTKHRKTKGRTDITQTRHLAEATTDRRTINRMTKERYLSTFCRTQPVISTFYEIKLILPDEAEDFVAYFELKYIGTICMKWEIICMKYQILFSWKNKKNISKYHLLKFLPSMQSINI